MTLKGLIRRTANRILKNAGYQIRHTRDDISMEAAILRRAKNASQIGTILDIGASDGRWAKMARRYYPTAHCLLIEANTFHEQGLQKFKSENPNSDYQIVAAGDSIGEVYFDAGHPFLGIASHSPQDSNAIIVPVTTVDELVRVRRLTPPYLLKLDTHGFEVPILTGAQNSLKDTALIIVEVYNFNFTPTSMKFWELCGFLEERGFRPIDLCEPFNRPSDMALWQMDLLLCAFNIQRIRIKFLSIGS